MNEPNGNPPDDRPGGDPPDDGPEGDPPDDAEDGASLSTTWYRSRLGIGVVLFHLALTVALVVGTSIRVGTDLDGLLTVVEEATQGAVPWPVYVFCVLGALGYVFTTLVDDFERDTIDLLQYSLRVPAALPLAGGVYLLSDVLLANVDGGQHLVVGAAFLTGLYVNRAYQGLSTVADRIFPGGTGTDDGSDSTTTDADGDAPHADRPGDGDRPADRHEQGDRPGDGDDGRGGPDGPEAGSDDHETEVVT